MLEEINNMMHGEQVILLLDIKYNEDLTFVLL